MQWQSLLVIELDDYCGGTVSLHRVDRVAERGYLKESSVSISIPLVGWVGVVNAGEGCILDPARPSLAVAVPAAVDYSPPWIDVTVVSSSCVLDFGVCFRRSSRACSFASCVMDWNANSPLLWDWDNHAPFGGNYKLSASSGSEHGHGSSSKSTISASVDSSSKTEKDPDLEGNPKNLGKTTFTLGAQAAGVEESQIGLKLGKRTYFEDVSAESSVKNPRPPTSLDSSVAPIGLVKKSRVPQQITHSTCCQVEGCDVDLTGAKDYHRKHRVCEVHSKCPRVVVAGQVRRFCQQCSRFHDLSEFDQKKRSCRRRLSDHNARRRKPRPNIISFTSTTFSSFYDEKNQMNFLWNKAPLDQMRTMVSTTSEDSQSFKYTQLKGPCVKLAREGNISRQLHMPNTQIINGFSALYHDVDKLLPLKGTATEILNQGSEASAGASNLDGAPDIRRALSLLSDSPWGSPGPRQTSSIIGFADANNVSIARPMLIPTVNSSHWMHEHSLSQAPQMLPFTVHRNSNQPHDFQLQKEPRTSVP